MSEQSQGPGWWQASDGKWYPPEQAPATQPPATEPIATPPAYGAPAASTAPAAAAAGGGSTGKIVAVVIALALIGGGAAFALTRGGGGSGGSVKAFCDTAKKFQNDESLDKAFNDPSKIDKVLTAFKELTKAAPSEIKSDMQTLEDAINKIGQAVKSAGNDPSKQLGAILAASAGLDEKKLEQAGNNLEKFGKEKCGTDFSFASSSSSSSEPSFSFDSSSFSSFDTSSLDSELSSFSSILGSDFFSSFSSEFNSSDSSS